MDARIQKILNATAQGEALHTWLDEHSDEVTPTLGEQLREVFNEAVDAREAGRAGVAAIAAAFVFLRAGRPRESLSSWIDYHQLRFLVTDTGDGYAAIHDDAATVAQQAEEAGFGDLAFRAAVLMADCAYFASTTVEEIQGKEQLLLITLQDLVMASQYAIWYESPIWMERFVSLLSATVNEALSRVWSTDLETERDEMLMHLVDSVEEVVPVDLQFSDDPVKTVQAAHELATLSYRYGVTAVGDARLTIVAQQAEYAGDLETWMDALFARYAGSRDAGTPDTQLAGLRKRLRERIEQFRTQFRSRAGRLWAGQELDRMAGEMLRDEFSAGVADDATIFAAMDALKTRTLLDQMQVGMYEFDDSETAAAAAEMERELLQFRPGDSEQENELVFAEMVLGSRLTIGSYWDRGERRAILADIEDFYAARGAGFDESAAPASLDDVMAALRPDEALIEYWIPFHSTHPALSLFMMGITADRVVTALVPVDEYLPESGFIGSMIIDGKQPLDMSPLGNAVIDLRTAIQRGDDAPARQNLQGFYQLLIGPLAQQGLVPADFRQWTIVPHGMLHHVPFGALMPAEDRFLIEDVALTVAPSASVWLALQRERPPATTFLGLANPNLSYTDLPALGGAETEVQKVEARLADSMDCTVFTGDAASESTLRENVAGIGIVHLATHGEFPEQDALDFHNLLLSPSDGHDGRLHAEEVRRMDFSAGRLVALSVCNGGLYRFGPGDEPYGLLPALLTAGAENVLGTLWPLEDEIGRFFMQDIYTSVLETSLAEAVQRACQDFIEDEALLRHWAGFVLVGTGRAVTA